MRVELLDERSRVRTTMVQMPAVNTPQFAWVLSRHHGAVAVAGATAGIAALARVRRVIPGTRW